MYVLDSDHVTFLFQGQSAEAVALRDRLRTLPEEQFGITVISCEEIVRGRLAKIARTRNREELGAAYGRFRIQLESFCEITILDYDTIAMEILESLRGIRIGTMDLRIAAIALSRQATLLSRNFKDFRKVPGLLVEDWTVEAGA